MTTHTSLDAQAHDHHHADEIDVFGFWIYILTDCILFATLFATYVVLQDNTYGGPALKELISLPYVFGETMFLLASSFTYGLAMLGMYQKNKAKVINWLAVTFILGLGFIVMEINEFVHLYMEGHSWHASGALTGFFALVATHGLHVSIGLLSMAVVMFQLWRNGVTSTMAKRLTYLGLFWHFLDIVWIFVFTIVYLMGAI